MHTETVTIHSQGYRLEGVLRTPKDRDQNEKLPTIFNPPGALGLAYGPPLDDYHEALVRAGFAVLSVNYRGYAGSEGEPGWFHPWQELDDMVNSVTYIETRDELDAQNIFCFGQGGTGAGNALFLTALDRRIRAVAVQAVFSTGEQWLRNMRSETDWQAFRRRVAENERQLVRGEAGELVDPREDLLKRTPERNREKSKKFWDSKITSPFHLSSAAKLMMYRPIDFAKIISPRPVLLFGVEDDVITPPEFGAEEIYHAIDGPKRLVMLRNPKIDHYQAFAASKDRVCDEIAEYFNERLKTDDFEVSDAT